MKKSALKLMSIAAMSAMMISCGGDSGEGQSTTPAETTPAETPTVTEEAIPDVAELTITGNDQMKFDLEKLEVYEGQTVRLTFKNVGSLPIESMGHNWTLLAKGIDPGDYANAALSHKVDDYQIPDRMDDVIAHTKLLGPGEEETIEFTAPASGLYKYVCTFPGHFAMMNGSFMVKKR